MVLRAGDDATVRSNSVDHEINDNKSTQIVQTSTKSAH